MDRGLIALGLVGIVLLSAGCGQPTAPMAGEPPNVLLITVDALRADHVGWAGGDEVEGLTPELDRLASESVVFRQAVTSFQGTTASMPSLMSGMFPSFEGVGEWRPHTWYGFADLAAPDERGERGLTRNVTTLAEILGSHGYATAGFNTNPHLSKANRFDQGFEHYEQFHSYLQRVNAEESHPLEGTYPPGDVVADAVTQWLALRPNRPFFLWVHFMDPHSPYLPPARCRELFPPPDLALADLDVNEALYNVLFTARGATSRAVDYRPPAELGLTKEGLIRHAHALYRGEVRCVDREIARVVEALRSSRDLDDTVVVLTADHGEEFGEHGHIFHDLLQPAPEELLRIPLLVRLPGGRAAGTAVDRQVRMVDIAPTILDISGLPGTGTMDGRSLRPLWEGTDDPDRIAYVSMIGHGVVRDGGWKYRLDKSTGTGRLFRLDQDPLELHDVAGEHPDVAEHMGDLWREFAAGLRSRGASAAGEGDGVVLDEDERRRLEALGYTDG